LNAGVPGLPCPQCGQRLVVSMEALMSLQPVVCVCGLTLRVDVERSRETLHDLRELQRRLAPLREPPWVR
jgi:hypothetical protein